MRKKLLKFVIVGAVFASTLPLGLSSSAYANGNVTSKITNRNYIHIGEEYSTRDDLDAGYMKNPVGSMSQPQDPEDTSLSYIDFYNKYGNIYAPEDSSVNGENSTLNPSPFQVTKQAPVVYNWKGFTWVGSMRPAKNDYDYINKIGTNPAFYSYLYVGDNLDGVNNDQTFDGIVTTPNTVPFKGENKVPDSMLNQTNDMTIPARYNQVRDDIMLSMRSKTDYTLVWPQVDLQVRDESGQLLDPTDGTTVEFKGSLAYPLNSYNAMSIMTRLKLVTANNQLKADYHDINEFNTFFNPKLDIIYQQAISNPNMTGLPGGAGAKINLKGFSRLDGDSDETTWSLQQREAFKNLNIEYQVFMGESSLNIPYSTDRSFYSIEISRPVISPVVGNEGAYSFTDLTSVNDIQAALNIDVSDDGVHYLPAAATAAGKQVGDTIGVNKDTNLRVALFSKELDGSISQNISGFLSLDDMATYLSQSGGIEHSALVYVYAGLDTTGIVGKLPSEILDSEGAYAVPYIRDINKEIKTGYVNVHYKTVDGVELSPIVPLSGIIGEAYITEELTFAGYRLVQNPFNAEGVFTGIPIDVIYEYELIPVIEPVEPDPVNTGGTNKEIQSLVTILMASIAMLSILIVTYRKRNYKKQ